MKSTTVLLSSFIISSILLISSCKKEPIEDPAPTPTAPTEVPNSHGKINTINYGIGSEQLATFTYDSQGRVKTIELAGVNYTYNYSSDSVHIVHYIQSNQQTYTKSYPINAKGYYLADSKGGTYTYNFDGYKTQYTFNKGSEHYIGVYTWQGEDLMKYQLVDTVPFNADSTLIKETIEVYEHINAPDFRNNAEDPYGKVSTHPISKTTIYNNTWYIYPNGSTSAKTESEPVIITDNYFFNSKGYITGQTTNHPTKGSSTKNYTYYP